MLVLDALEKMPARYLLTELLGTEKIFLNSVYQVEMKATLHTKLTAV